MVTWQFQYRRKGGYAIIEDQMQKERGVYAVVLFTVTVIANIHQIEGHSPCCLGTTLPQLEDVLYREPTKQPESVTERQINSLIYKLLKTSNKERFSINCSLQVTEVVQTNVLKYTKIHYL